MPLNIPKAARDDWETPAWLFDMLDEEFNFTVDGMAADYNHRLPRYWTKDDDALSQDWFGERIFVNPPFPKAALAGVAEKAYINRHNTITAMVTPIKADQVWWHEFAMKGEVRFVKGRVTFRGAKGTFPGPIAVVVWGAGEPGTMKTIERMKVKK